MVEDSLRLLLLRSQWTWTNWQHWTALSIHATSNRFDRMVQVGLSETNPTLILVKHFYLKNIIPREKQKSWLDREMNI